MKKVQKEEEVVEEDPKENHEEEELRRLEEIAILSSIYNRNEKKFQRNPNLSHIVHAAMNLAQFLSVLINELFHHVHHAINRKMRLAEPSVPSLPEERNPIFIAYPMCMIISIIMAILWLRYKTFERILDTTLVGCAVGIIIMLLSAILSMRHAEIYINIEEVSDDELLTHPIFIHNFIICVTSILAMLFYLIHFWILYECWLSRKNKKSRNDAQPSTSENSEYANYTRDDFEPILKLETLRDQLSTNMDQVSLQNEPIVLYCCCIDYSNYRKERKTRILDHEFQVVHIK